MGRTKGQSGARTSAQEEVGDERLDHLCDLVERFLDKDLRREVNAQNPPPPLAPPPLRLETSDSVSERFLKLKPSIV